MRGVARAITFISTAALVAMFSNLHSYTLLSFFVVGFIIGITASFGWED